MAHRRSLVFLDTDIRSLEPKNRARYVALRDYLQHMLLDTVEAGRAEGVFTTPIPADAVRSVLVMCQGVANWFRPDGPLTAEEVAERHVLLSLGTVGYRDVVTGEAALPFQRWKATPTRPASLPS
ncbi:hypothetical protein [Streptomyces sp. WG5]|uniref:hypothetical protein n=1 Tax=Streptomyces sp. WG5 TaxID=3417648 RepID=UPI003CEB4B0A